MLSHKEQSLLDALVPHAQEKGVEIVTVEVMGSKKSPTIRVYIDTDHGVGFDELSEAQSWINDVMERIDPFPGAYMLEVSSPGIDRPLRTPQHFARFTGGTAVVKTSKGIDGRSQFTATIVSADENTLVLNDNGTNIDIPFELIKKAHLKGIIDFNAKKEL
ncbi:MAG: ribosome maturation factor RimP [Eggerthellales bacterium]|nr:ribosome maturation factor RimP [Eggerthellales bacterium]